MHATLMIFGDLISFCSTLRSKHAAMAEGCATSFVVHRLRYPRACTPVLAPLVIRTRWRQSPSEIRDIAPECKPECRRIYNNREPDRKGRVHYACALMCNTATMACADARPLDREKRREARLHSAKLGSLHRAQADGEDDVWRVDQSRHGGLCECMTLSLLPDTLSLSQQVKSDTSAGHIVSAAAGSAVAGNDVYRKLPFDEKARHGYVDLNCTDAARDQVMGVGFRLLLVSAFNPLHMRFRRIFCDWSTRTKSAAL